MNELPVWLKFAEEITLRAGKMVSDLYLARRQTTFKIGLDGRPSTITEADEKSEAHLSHAIQQRFPDHGIYGEEGTNIGLRRDFVWYLDPLDGTTNFWRHIPLFGISVGLTYKKKPILGVLYFPALDLILSAHADSKTMANGQEVRVSDRNIEKSLYYVSCQEARDGLFFPSIGKTVGWVKAIDASSYEFAQLAMGDAEIYTFPKKSPQDMVAGAIIVERAGGQVTDEKNQPWTTDSSMIVATNGQIHQQVLELLNQDLKLKKI